MADDPTTPDPDAPGDVFDDGADDTPDDLGDAGKAALTVERDARKRAERDLRASQQQFADAKAAGLSLIEQARAEGRAEVQQAAFDASNERVLKAEIKAAAAGKLRRPEYATALLDLTKFTIAEDGTVDEDAISSAIDELVKQDPALAFDGTPGPLPGGGARPTTGASMDDVIRRAAGRR